MCDHLGDRRLGDEAEIAGAGGRLVGDEAGGVVGRVQVDLLLAEFEGGGPFPETNALHAEHLRVEVAGLGDVGDGQYEVVEAGDLHGGLPEQVTPELATSGR